MSHWRVRALSDGRWQVLTPGGTQACAPEDERATAIAAAEEMMAYEGDGVLCVDDEPPTPESTSVL